MKFRFLLIVLLACISPNVGLSSDVGVLCVQNQLTALGHNAGPPDGLFGRRTLGAFRAYARTIDHPGETFLSPGNATAWCRTIGLQNSELRQFWPSQEMSTRVIIGDNVHENVAAMVERQIPRLHRQIARRMQVELAGTDLVIVGSSVDDLFRLVTRHLPYRTVFTRLRVRLNDQCGDPMQMGAFTISGIAVVCVPPNRPFGPDISIRLLSNILAHEASHLVVFQVIGLPPSDAPDADYVSLAGPSWLHEGLAMVHGAALSSGQGPRQIRRHAAYGLTGVEYPPLKRLEDREALDTLNREVYLVGAIAVSILVETHGYSAIGDLLEHMALGHRFEEAFQTAMVQDPAEFYANFPELSRPD